MLNYLGYQIETKTSSLEALELFREQPERFDLIMTDMTMPQMTGDRLAAEIMKTRPDMPVILYTGFSHKITEIKAKQHGIKAFLMKPLVLRDLASTVRKVLDQNKE
jgi:CheY-like chemotaxis protein